MANIKQQKKRIKTNDKAKLRNAAFKSSLKSALKEVEVAIEAKDFEAAVVANSTAAKKLDKAVSKGLVHKHYVARQKSRLTKQVNALK